MYNVGKQNIFLNNEKQKFMMRFHIIFIISCEWQRDNNNKKNKCCVNLTRESRLSTIHFPWNLSVVFVAKCLVN